MAVTTIVPMYPAVQQSPYSALMACYGDDATSPGTLARALVLAGVQSGPLKELLTRTADWTVFNLGGTKCGEVHCRVAPLLGGGLVSQQARFWWEATGLKAAVAINNGSLLVEIRLSQSERY